MDRDRIIKQIERCHNLPSIPTVAMEVLKIARSDDIDLHEIAALVSNDPALTSKVIKTVNSPFYGLAQRVSTISAALVILGIEAVKTLVLGFSLVGGLASSGLRGKTQIAYWRRSLYSGASASLLCQRMGVPQSEEVFLAALLQDMGILTLMQVVGDPYLEILSELPNWSHSLLKREREALGIDHCEAGLLLAEQWNLPAILAQTIRWHHRPEQAQKPYQQFCHIVRLSSLCAEVFMGHDARKMVRHVHNYGGKVFSVGPAVLDDLLADVGKNTRQLAELFEMNIGQMHSYEDILAEASATLQDLTLRSQMQAKQFKVEAETDGLTGVANRRKLESTIETEFDRARKFNRPLSVLFIDADHFKQINDTRGHAAGDRALQHLAELLKRRARPMDAVARYGGEEFVLLMPEMAMGAAVALAEQIRAAVQATPVDLGDDGAPWPLTISVGVSSYDGLASPYRAGGQLIQAADKAAYAAKTAGRNTVRVFSPRPKPKANTP
ncbi:MAG: hypothetical protein BIFFINMI_02678 [Phycisphaerae bacterium]|nr:hypothetical protein [Phycisphaerae bacterium]